MKVQNLKKYSYLVSFSSAISQSRNLSFTMILVVKKQIQWFNLNMKNLASSVRKSLLKNTQFKINPMIYQKNRYKYFIEQS